MATHYNIQEVTSGLRIQAHQDMLRWERPLLAVLAMMFVGIMSASFLGGWWWTISSIIAGVVIYGVVRGNSAELQVTNVEFITKGDLGRRVRTPQIVCTGDVLGIEFKEGDPFKWGFHGLYAVTAHRTICLLPFLDYKATSEVIRTIEDKFPGLAEGWRSGQPLKERPGLGGVK